MAEINKKFEEAVKKLEAVKQQIENDPQLIPITFQIGSGERSITKESLNEEFVNLKKAPFTIAVCGEVKAGKSTLLNSILFGDNILPTFDTPLTAKLTFIKKSDKPYNYFKANFYSKQEWSVVCSNSSINQELEENLQLAAERYGIYKGDCIEDQTKSIEVFDLQDLEQYVSAINKEDDSSLAGKFTPYVKNVEIFINKEELQDIQIVDTPGLNDPNAINSVETTNWINNAHAIVYVTDVKGFAEPDLKFFQQFMAERGPKYRIIVQNKIDKEENYVESRLYMGGLGQKPEYKKIKLFSNEKEFKETICSYSGLQMLIHKKEKQGIPLTEDEEYYKSEDSDPEKKYNPDNLEKKISDKLFKNEGAGRIEAMVNTLNQVYEINIDKIINETENCKSQIEDFQKDIKEIQSNREKLQDKRIEFNEKLKNKKKEQNLDAFLTDIDEKIRLQLKDDQKKILKKFDDEISFRMDTGNYVTVVSYFSTCWNEQIKECIESLRKMMNTMVKNYVSRLETIAEELEGDLKRLLNKKHIGLFSGKIRENWALPSNVNEFLDYKDVLPRNFFTNLFHNNQTLKAQIYKEVESCLGSFFENKLGGIPKLLTETLENRLNDFSHFIAQKLEELENQLESIEKNYNIREQEVCKLNENIEKMKQKQNLLEKKKMELANLKKEIAT